MNAEFPSVKLTWQALLHALISWNRRHIVQGVYELHAQSSFMILRDTANNPICLFFLFLLKTLLLAQEKWSDAGKQTPTLSPSLTPSFVYSVHFIALYKAMTCFPYKVAFLPLCLARIKEKKYSIWEKKLQQH